MIQRALTRIMGRISIIIYLVGIAFSVFLVELVKKSISYDVAAGLVSSIAISLVVSSLMDLGITSRVHWSLLTYSRTFRAISSEGRPLSFLEKIRWLVSLSVHIARNELNSSIIVAGFAIQFIAVTVFIHGNPNFSLLDGLALMALVLSNMAKRITFTLLDGTLSFAHARVVNALPNIIAFFVIGLILLLHLPNLVLNDVLIVICVSNFFVSLIFFSCALKSPAIGLDKFDDIISVNDTKLSRWFGLEILANVQNNVIFIISPLIALNGYVVLIYYALKALGVSLEVNTQLIKEFVAHRVEEFNEGLGTMLARLVLLAFAPAFISTFVFAFESRSASAYLGEITLFFFYGILMGVSNGAGQIGLQLGGKLPILTHAFSALVYLIALINLVPALGLTGYLLSNVASVLFFTLFANILLMRNACFSIREN